MALQRKYTVYEQTISSKSLPVNIKIIDAATPFLKQIAAESPKMLRSALKSAGWWLSTEIKTGIKSGAPGGQKYPEFSKIKSSRNEYMNVTLSRISKKTGTFKVVRQRIGSKGRLMKEKGPHKPLGKLARAVGYRYYADSNRVAVGFLSFSAIEIMRKLEEGYQKPTTGRMRRFFFASGLALSDKPDLIIPAYRTIGPVYQKTQGEVFKYMENKIFGYMAKVEAGA